MAARKAPGAPQPTPEIYDALKKAALAYNVPLSLLEAIALIESQFDPTADGPVTAEGWRAKGMMQLSPKIIEKYSVGDPYDPRSSAMGAAALLQALGRGTGWDVKRMLAAYVWGPVKLAAADAQGSAWPREVDEYVAKVTAARKFYQGIADVRGWTPADAAPDGGPTAEGILDAAWFDLLDANPQWMPAQAGYQQWQAWYAKNPKPAASDLREPWEQYAKAFERAPITDASTVAPWKIQPSSFSVPTLQQLVNRGKQAIERLDGEIAQTSKQAKRVAKDVGDDIATGFKNLGTGALELGGGLITAALLFGALYLVISSRNNPRS